MSRFQDFLNKLKRKETKVTMDGSILAHLSERIVGEVLSRKETAVVGLLGLAFKENVSDIRNSSSIKLLKLLASEIHDVIVYDPLVAESFVAEKPDSIDDFLKSSKIVVLCVGHNQILDELKSKDLSEKVFFDPRNMLPELKSKVEKYVGLSI